MDRLLGELGIGQDGGAAAVGASGGGTAWEGPAGGVEAGEARVVSGHGAMEGTALGADELRKRRWTEEDLAKRRKTDAGKVRVARRLRAETLMTLDWIAQRLTMGCRHTVTNCLKG